MLGKLEELLLLTIKSFDGFVRASEIREAIERRSRSKATFGKVVSTIQRLIVKGLIECRNSSTLRDAGQRHIKVYKLTEKGEVATRDIVTMTARFVVAAQYPGAF